MTEFYVVTNGLLPPAPLGTLQNLRPAAVYLWVSQELQGDQYLAREPQKHSRPTTILNHHPQIQSSYSLVTNQGTPS